MEPAKYRENQDFNEAKVLNPYMTWKNDFYTLQERLTSFIVKAPAKASIMQIVKKFSLMNFFFRVFTIIGQIRSADLSIKQICQRVPWR